MTLLFHGENQTALQNRLAQIRATFTGEQVFLEGKSLKEEQMVQNFNSGSLLTIGQKLIVIDNLSANKDLPETSFAPSSAFEIILIEDKKITPTQIKTFQKMFGPVQEEEFKVDPIVFKFLDSLEPGNLETTLKLWMQYKKSEAPEIILVMLARQLRLLLLASSEAPQKSPDWTRLSPWQQQKLQSQAQKFSLPQLKELFKRLCDIDSKSKTGKLPLDLSNSLELFLLSF